MKPKLRLNEMTRDEIRAIAPETTLVLPITATEQHGPHLPVLVDHLSGETIALRAAERAAADVPVTVAPALPFGSSHHHLPYFALSLSADTLSRVLSDLCRTAIRAGFRRIFMLNGHGGNEECIRQVARDVVLEHDVLIGAASYWTVAFDSIAAIAGEAGIVQLPGHAGNFETSYMLALRPELVKRELLPLPTTPAHRGGAATGGVSRASREPKALPLVARHGSWERLNGYSDDAGKASPELGQRFLDVISRDVAAELVRFHGLD